MAYSCYMISKTCGMCRLKKSLDDFYNDKSQSDGKSCRCKSCIRTAQDKWRADNPDAYKESNTKSAFKTKLKRYGLTENSYMSMLESQDNRCAICVEPLDFWRGTHIDHCHDTGVVRGVLCSTCNNGLGMFKDDRMLLRSAIKYLS